MYIRDYYWQQPGTFKKIVFFIFVLMVVKGDPNNYPIHYNFSTIPFDTGTSCFTQELATFWLKDEEMLDQDSGYVIVKKGDYINFSGLIEDTNTLHTYWYSINLWIYTYEEQYDIVLFWLPTKGAFWVGAAPGEEFPNWWGSVTVDNGIRYISYTWQFPTGEQYSFYDSHSSFEKAGWQYFSFRSTPKNLIGYLPDDNDDITISYLDSTKNLISEDLFNTSPAIYQRYTDHSTLGSFYDGSDYSYALNGLIYKVSIWNTLNNGYTDPVEDLIEKAFRDSLFNFVFEDIDQSFFDGTTLK